MPEFWMCLMQYMRSHEYIRSLYKLLSSYWIRHIQNIVIHLRLVVLQKEQCVSTFVQPEILQGREGFVELGQFNKNFIEITRKKTSQRNILQFFPLNILKTTSWIENLTQRSTQSGFFSLKSRYFFLFSKKAGEASPSPSPLVSHLWAWLNMHQYFWLSLNILQNAWINCSDYASSEYIWSFCMFHRLLKTWQVWKCARVLWIWRHCICKGYSFFWICVNMAPNVPQQCLNMHCPLTMFLNMPGNAWINFSVLTICLVTLDIRQGFVNATGIKYTDGPDLRY